jgi:hypothetical protein
MNVLAFETFGAKNKASEISWSIFIQLTNYCFFFAILIFYEFSKRSIKAP